MKNNIRITKERKSQRKFNASEDLKGFKYSNRAREYDEKRINVGKIKNPDAYFRFTGVCGDTMEIYLKIKSGVIIDAKFQTTGCTAARVSGSTLTKMIKGRRLKEAEKIRAETIIEHLGGLPPLKIHCACLAKTTLEKAIEQYRKMREMKRKLKKEEL